MHIRTFKTEKIAIVGSVNSVFITLMRQQGSCWELSFSGTLIFILGVGYEVEYYCLLEGPCYFSPLRYRTSVVNKVPICIVTLLHMYIYLNERMLQLRQPFFAVCFCWLRHTFQKHWYPATIWDDTERFPTKQMSFMWYQQIARTKCIQCFSQTGRAVIKNQ